MSKKVKLISICKPKQYKTLSKIDLIENGKFSVYGANGIIGKSDKFTHENPTLMVTCRGATCGTLNISEPNSYINGNAMAFDDINEEFDLKYLYYYLFTRGFNDVISGSAQPQITRENLKNLEVLKPSLEQQKQIAKTLDKANELIELRKESITALDTLAKSIFIDMFGDPVSNPKGWETKGIESLVSKEKYSIKRGPFGGSLKKEIFVKEGYLVYEQYHALNNDFTFARYFINEKKYQELKAFEVKAGDIIISCSGVYLGKLAVIPNDFKKGIINQALLKISLDENIMKNVMFINIFTNPNFKKKFFGNNIGSGVPNFPSMPDFKRFEFIFPPINLQNKFAKIIEKIEEQKSLYEKELEVLQMNFDALLQKNFQG